MRPDCLAVLGLGAIGGSVAWQARRSGVASVVGFSPERGEAVQALRAGALTDIADTPERAVREADFVVLAAPPDAILQLLESLPRSMPSRTLLTDVASVKLPIISRARDAGLASRFAGSHPFAGTHHSGWSAARPDLFREAIIYVCTTGTEGENAARQVMHFWEALFEAHPVLIPAEAHDRQLAWTSHLPQAVASALASTLARSSDLTGASWGPGARDTTRLAASNAELWTEILLLNRKEVAVALAQAGEDLRRLAALIAEENRAGLRDFLERGVAFRRLIDGIPGSERSSQS
jgi:prephenate dehydrogenase